MGCVVREMDTWKAPALLETLETVETVETFIEKTRREGLAKLISAKFSML